MNPDKLKDAAEQWLDETLKDYGAASQRIGLEARILARLQAHAKQQQRRWIFAFAACTAAVMLTIFVTDLRQPKPAIQARAVVSQPSPGSGEGSGNMVSASLQSQGSDVPAVHKRLAATRTVRTPLRTAPTDEDQTVLAAEKIQVERQEFYIEPIRKDAETATTEQSSAANIKVEALNVQPIANSQPITIEKISSPREID